MTLQEIYQSQNNKKNEMVVRVPELIHLVKHLDLLYSELINRKESNKEYLKSKKGSNLKFLLFDFKHVSGIDSSTVNKAV